MNRRVTGLLAVTAVFMACAAQAGVVSNLVIDSSFEGLVTSEPNDNTTPWVTDETSANYWIVTRNANAVTGSWGLRHRDSWWKGHTIMQSLDTTLDTNKTYEASVWVRGTAPSGTGANDPRYYFELCSAPTNNGDYSVIHQFVNWGSVNTTAWEQVTAELDASTLAAYHGHYLQIHLRVRNQMNANVHFDDVVFGVASDQPDPQVVAGWHSWAVTNVGVSGQGPDEVMDGWTGDMGVSVVSSGGGQQVVAVGSTDNTYGTDYAISNAPVSTNSVQLRSSFGGNAAIKRLDFTVSNNTGTNISLASLHFDYDMVYGVLSNTTIKLSHLSGASDLDDSPWAGYNIMAQETLTSWSWQDKDLILADTAMGDVELAHGETAAFRIEVDVNTNTAPAAGVNIDNIAVVAVVPEGLVPPVPLDAYGSWSNDYGLVEGELGDDDDDGLSNLYEYGLGGDPTNGFVDGNIPVMGASGGAMLYIHVQRSDDTNLVYYLETDTDLVNAPGWTNAGYTVVGVDVTGDTFDYVTNSVPTTDQHKFIQLVIENN
jgi:hypothetical protein